MEESSIEFHLMKVQCFDAFMLLLMNPYINSESAGSAPESASREPYNSNSSLVGKLHLISVIWVPCLEENHVRTLNLMSLHDWNQ